MYTYTQSFAGVPLSQLGDKRNSLLEFFGSLTDYTLRDIDLDVLEDFDFEDDDEFKNQCTMLISWLMASKEKLARAGYKLESSYHGSDDEPRILGKYFDDGIPEFGAGRLKVKENFDKASALEKEAIELFSDFPMELFAALPESWGPGVWANNHSS